MSAAVTSDEQIITGIVEWSRRERKVPGQNRIMAEYGIGKSRVVRLLAIVDQRTAEERDRTSTGVKPSGPPQQRPPVQTERTEPARSGDDGLRTDSAAPASQPGPGVSRGEGTGPGQTDEEHALVGGSGPDRDGEDAVIPGPTVTPVQTGPAMDRAETVSAGPDWALVSDGTPRAEQPANLVRSVAAAVRKWATIEPDRDAADQSDGHGRVKTWPVLLLALPAFVAIWSGWVGLGGLTGFGVVHPLPGIADTFEINTAITLPIGVETYAAFALRVWLSGRVHDRARRFARTSSILSLVLGAGGQVAYHLMVAAGVTRAPWGITTVVACIPVAVLGMGAALAHLIGKDSHA